MDNTNHGLIAPEIQKSDWASGTIKYEDRGVFWNNHLHLKERQSTSFDTFSCVTFSLLNCIEMQVNYLLSCGKLSVEDLEPWMEDGQVNLSDRYLAIKSGTTKAGNGLQKVLDTFRKNGCCPDKSLRYGGNSFEQYHDKKLITLELDKQAKKLLDYITVSYEWAWGEKDKNIAEILKYELKHAPIQVAGTVCNGWSGNVDVPTCPVRQYHHATVIYDIDENYLYNLDQYIPFEKRTKHNYPFLCGLKVVVNAIPKEIPAVPKLPDNPTEEQKKSFIESAFKWLSELSTNFKRYISGK